MSRHSHARQYPTGYTIPEKNILLLTCIDLRLMDEIVHFMEYDNLTNRYDQFTLAGASLATQVETFKNDFKADAIAEYDDFAAWLKTFKHHIDLAQKLHAIKDVYIIEHRNCGAYATFLKEGEQDTDDAERDCHLKYAKSLCKQIKKEYGLNAHSFLMDLRGNMELLYSTKSKDKHMGLNHDQE